MVRRRSIRPLLAAGVPVIAAFVPMFAAAQLAPDTPRLVSPHGPAGLGVYWLRGETLPGDGDALLVTWAPAALPAGVRLRGGGGTGADGDVAGFGGIDVQTPLARRSAGMPADLEWYTGIGVARGGYTLATIPLGVSAGTAWSSGSVWMAPYVSAGIAADLRLGDSAPEDEFIVQPALDIGLDLALDRNRSFVLRTAASLGDRQTIAVGIVVGGGRGTR